MTIFEITKSYTTKTFLLILRVYYYNSIRIPIIGGVEIPAVRRKSCPLFER